MKNLLLGTAFLLALSSASYARTEPTIHFPIDPSSAIEELNNGLPLPSPIDWIVAPEGFYASGTITVVPFELERENDERLDP